MFVFWEGGKFYLALSANASSTASGPPSPFALARGRLDAFALIYYSFLAKFFLPTFSPKRGIRTLFLFFAVVYCNFRAKFFLPTFSPKEKVGYLVFSAFSFTAFATKSARAIVSVLPFLARTDTSPASASFSPTISI